MLQQLDVREVAAEFLHSGAITVFYWEIKAGFSQIWTRSASSDARLHIVDYELGRRRYCALGSCGERALCLAVRTSSASVDRVSLVEHDKIMSYNRAFATHHEPHGDPLGFVVMSSMEQIHRA